MEYASSIVPANPDHQIQLGNASTLLSHNIFTYDGSTPMIFFIPFDDPNRYEYRDKIIRHGGITTDTQPNESTFNRIIILSSYNVKGQLCFKLTFVDDSIKQNRSCDLNNYKYSPGENFDLCVSLGGNRALNATQGREIDVSYSNMLTRSGRASAVRPSHRFNDTKDEYILKQVRLNPRLRNSHKFFDELATHDILKGHTGNSIRSRYRNHLESRLGYVYKTEENGTLLKTPDGKNIRQSLDKLPKTLKNRFTVLEDYQLCTEIVEYCKGKYLLDLQEGNYPKDENGKPKEFDYYIDFQVPVSFFTMMAKNYPSHSYHSWRDRYRKFVRQYGAQKFIDDYNTAIKNGELPSQMKNLTSKKANIGAGFKELLGSSYNFKPLAIKQNEEMPSLGEGMGEIRPAIDDVVQKNNPYTAVEPSNSIHIHNDLEEPSQQLPASQEGLNIDIRYIPENILHEDLINENFYKIKPNEIRGEVQRILTSRNDNKLPYIFSAFNDIGINDVFTAHILMATSADIAKIQVFIDKFLEMVKYIEENEIYKGLQFEDTDGLWTAKLDEYLLSQSEQNMRKLKKIHKYETIQTRREFLDRISQFR